MLSVFRLSAGKGVHFGGFAERITRIRLRRGQFFKNLCDDGLARGLHDRAGSVDESDGQTAKPFGDAPDIVRAVCVRQSDAEFQKIA